MEANKWIVLGSKILANYAFKSTLVSFVKFKIFFKLTPTLVDIVWNKLVSIFKNSEEKHLLWTLHYLKTESTNDTEIASLLSTNRETMRLHVESTVEKLFQVLPEVCFFSPVS